MNNMKHKILMTLALLITAVTGTWAQDVTWNVSDISTAVDGIMGENEPYTSDGITMKFVKIETFGSCTIGQNIEIMGGSGVLEFTAPEGMKFAKIVINGSGSKSFGYWNQVKYGNGDKDGVYSLTWEDEPAEVVTTSSTTGSWDLGVYNASTIEFTFESTLDFTWDAKTKTGTFEMPAYDVELVIEYYDPVTDVVANQDPDKTSDYWCTYYNPTTNVKVSTAGVSIYKATLSGETLALSKVDGNVIKGGQAVVLKSTVGGELEMEETPDDATGDYTGNELKGTTEAINGNGKIYVLNYTQENGVGFYQLSDNGTLGANKAYLEYNGSNARAFFSFGFDDETSGIENTSRTDDTNRGEVYDLQGRQVKQPARGLYIKSGKKVVIK